MKNSIYVLVVLRAAKLTWNYTYSKIAEKAGCSAATVYNVLEGKTKKSKYLPAIVKALRRKTVLKGLYD